MEEDARGPETVPVPASKPIKSIALALSAAAFVVLAVTGWIVFYPDIKNEMSLGVSIGGVVVSGLTMEQAEAKLKKAYPTPKDLRLLAGKDKYVVALKEFSYGIDYSRPLADAWAIGRRGVLSKIGDRLSAAFFREDIRLVSEYDSAKVRNLVEIIDREFSRKPVDAKIDFEKSKIIPQTDGRKIDKRRTYDVVREQMALYDGHEIKLPVVVVKPKVKTADYAGVDLKNPLSTFSTKFSEGQVMRSKNLRRIADLLSGYEIKPGGSFSYNESVGDRTKERGFYPAPEIQNGQMKVGYGGGACQGSTTLFNAALLADMTDFEWSPHSQQSHYADPGRDAAVYYGKIDLKFKNPHPYPVFLYATATHGVMTMTMYSRVKLKHKIELRSDWWGRAWPGEKKTLNPDLAPGKEIIVSKGASSLSASLFRRYIYPDGKVVEKQMLRNGNKVLRYPGAKRLIEVGPEPEKPKAPPEQDNDSEQQSRID